MSIVQQQVGRARWRLTINGFLHWMSVGLLTGAALWGVAILVERLQPVGIPIWPASAMAGGFALLIAMIGTLRTRATPLAAAVAVDRAAGLKERLSTAMLVGRQDDVFARAAVNDAEAAAGRIHVPSHIKYRAPELLPWSVASVVSVVMLALFLPTMNLFANSSKKAEQIAQTKAQQQEMKEVKTNVAEQIKSAKEAAENNPDLKDLKDDLAKLEIPDKPTSTPDDIRREAVKKIEDITQKLEEKMKDEKFDVMEQTKQMMAKLNVEKGDDLASKLGDALQKGDTQAAQDALKEMKKELEEAAKKDADPEAQKRMAEMTDKLEKLADQISKMDDTKQITKDLQNKAGLSEDEAKKLMEQVAKADPKELQKMLQQQLQQKGMSEKQVQELTEKICQNKQAQQQMKQMSKSLQQAAQAMQQCQSPGSGEGQSSAQQAANALSDAAEQLSQMEMSEQLMNDLQAQMAQMDQLKKGVCQGNCNKPGNCNNPGDKIGNQGPQYGQGIGEKVGREKSQHAFKPEKANVRMQGGSIIGKMLVDGPQLKGEATAEVRDAVNAAQRDAQDAIDRRTVPRQYERVMREYFDRLAGLAEKDKKPAESTTEEKK